METWIGIFMLIILALFIAIVVIVATSCDYSSTWKQESCKVNISSLSGQLMRAQANAKEDQTTVNSLRAVYNNYVRASECGAKYLL